MGLFLSTVRRNLATVACAVSGGVDSAVAVHLLKAQGHRVMGVFMQNWDFNEESGSCTGFQADLEDAKYTCDRLGVELHLVDFVKEYWNDVFHPLLCDYRSGLTPNPDVLCNR